MAEPIPSIEAAGPPQAATCIYYCYDGVWVLVGQTGGPGYYCNQYLPGPCETGTEMQQPAIPMAANATASTIPENHGEYQFKPSTKTFHLVQGKCQRGLCLKPELTLAEVQQLVPQVAKTVESIQSDSGITSLFFVIPAIKATKP